jgi:hypothetical protein
VDASVLNRFHAAGDLQDFLHRHFRVSERSVIGELHEGFLLSVRFKTAILWCVLARSSVPGKSQFGK